MRKECWTAPKEEVLQIQELSDIELTRHNSAYSNMQPKSNQQTHDEEIVHPVSPQIEEQPKKKKNYQELAEDKTDTSATEENSPPNEERLPSPIKALPLQKDDSTSESNPYKLTWRDFNTTFLSNIEPLTDEQKKACLKNQDMIINLKPFMIETPYTVRQSVKFQQVVELFRNMNLRHLPVINNESNTLVGIITR